MRASTVRWSGCDRVAVQTGPTRFTFLSLEQDIAQAGGWNDRERPRLWTYNAHYFDDLVARDADARADWHRPLLQRWIAENPPATGAGWEPYPLSLRIVNWIKWSLAGNAPDAIARDSLAVQARWLRQHLEWHLLGNHLWANAKALVFAGAFFEGDEARAWSTTGLSILRRELDEQILTDGGHFERSPMYHAIVFEDVLDLLQLARIFPSAVDLAVVDSWRDAAQRMQTWLQAMTHPDGGIAFFNDSALGIAAEPAALHAYAQRLDVHAPAAQASLQPMPATGYVRLQNKRAVLIADVGEIGPDYLPGHAHADTLSFELSVDGARVVVNSGISGYDAGAERLRQRGTAAHSTVQVDGLDSSEVWSSFRVGRRARPSQVSWREERDRLTACAAHDGYSWRPGSPRHRREWMLSEGALTIVDNIDGPHDEAVAFFHLHPAWRASAEGERHGLLQRGQTQLRWSVEGDVEVAVDASTWHPGFGQSIANQLLRVRWRGGALLTRFEWR